MSAIRFAWVYLAWLQRRDRTAHEPLEPLPHEHGLPQQRDSSGQMHEHPLAEPLRRHVHRVWEEQVCADARARKAVQESV